MNKLKSIVFNGLPWGLAFFGLSFIWAYFLIHTGLQLSVRVSLYIGLAALLANGALYNRFAKPLKMLDSLSVHLQGSETLLISSPANHLVDESLVPGKLFLTNERLIFRSIKSEEYSWALRNLEPINFYRSIWNSGGEIILSTVNEISLMFEVDKLKPWKDTLLMALK